MTGRRSVRGTDGPGAPRWARPTPISVRTPQPFEGGDDAVLARLAARVSGAGHVVICREVDGVPKVMGRAAADAGSVIWSPPIGLDPGSAVLDGDPRLSPYRAALATPILAEDGTRIGCLWALSMAAHPLSPEAREGLADVARAVAQSWSARQLAIPTVSPDPAQDAMIASFIDHAPVALALVDRTFRYVRVSPRWLEELKLVGTPVIGRQIDEVFPGAMAVWGDIYQRCLAGESFRNDAVEARDGEGNPCWIRAEIVPWRGRGGDVTGVLTLRHDMTELMTSVRATQLSDQRLSLAVETGGMVVFDWDAATGRITQQGRTELFSGANWREAHSFDDFLSGIHPEDAPAVADRWRDAMRSGVQRLDATYRVLTDHGYRWVANASVLILGPDGQVQRMLGIVRDVTHEQDAARVVEAARNQAEAASRAKSEFLANMSHEIRTPLNGVLGVATALAATRLDGRQREMVQLIEHSAVALDRLLADILDLSRVEAGHLDTVSEPFDLMEILHDVAALFAPRAREKGLTFRLEGPSASEAWYLGDAARIRQIVSNLLSNAVKFTVSGEVSMVLTAGPVAGGGPRRVEIAIADTGIGFDEQETERLFQRFEQADGSITREFGGSGLGLAISRSLAERMGGRISAVSKAGLGSTFTLGLDLRAAAPPEAGDPPAEAAEFLRPVKVLLAEDHPANRRVVELILQAIGADLTMVDNGALAVRAATETRYDVILMDVQMPVLDGLSAIRAATLLSAVTRAVDAPG